MIKIIRQLRWWYPLLFLLPMLYLQQCLSAEQKHEEIGESVQILKILKSHKKKAYDHITNGQYYPGYMVYLDKKWVALKEKYTTASTFLDMSMVGCVIAPIFDEIMLYHIDTCSFEEVKYFPLVVSGYYRQAVGTAKYNIDMSCLILHFAHLELIKKDKKIKKLTKDFWSNYPQPTLQAGPILKMAARIGNYSFISKWLVACMQQEMQGAYINIRDLQDILTEEQRKRLLLDKDNFLNAPLLFWLSKQWPAIAAMFENSTIMTYFKEHNPYLALWIETCWTSQVKDDNNEQNQENLTDGQITTVINAKWANRNNALLALALNGRLKKKHFSRRMENPAYVLAVLMPTLGKAKSARYRPHRRYSVPKNEVHLLHYYLQYILSHEQCKKLLWDTINETRASCGGFYCNTVGFSRFFNEAILPKKDVFFFSIKLEIMIEGNVGSHALVYLIEHKKKKEVFALLSDKNKAITRENERLMEKSCGRKAIF